MTPRRLGILAALAAVAVAGAALAGRLRRGGRAAETAPPPSPGTTSAAPAPPPPRATAGAAVEGYCMKERKKVAIEDPEPVKTKNGRDAVRGKCPDCGVAIFRMGKMPGA